jgi:Cft2 family RNA processing exonuclease
MLEWDRALKICNTDLYLDSRQARSFCAVSHAHSDHLPDTPHGRTFATPATAALAGYRSGVGAVVELEYGTEHAFCPETAIRLLPAGHLVGSAMVHVTRPDGTLLYTGDFKLRDSLTAAAAEPCRADVLVMESTYGRPLFRFPPWRQVVAELVERASGALRAGRQPVVMGYSLGKAQEAVRVLTDAGLPVTCHGAVFAMNQISERLGVRLGPYRRYRFEDFHGPAALDLAERGVLIAPPHVARSGFVTRFDDPLRIVLTGWSMLKGAQYRYGVDHALPLSDHADFDELLELIDRVQPRKVFTFHGYRDFADVLRQRGIDACCAEPAAQLSLFGD